MEIYKQITESELNAYLEMVKDTNALHYGETPIIPGNLLIFILEQMYLETYQKYLKYMKVTFCSPAYLNKKLCFIFSHTTFQIKDANQKMILTGGWRK